MTDSFERARSRLNNLQAIEPLLGALRTMSLGTMQKAQMKLQDLQEYEENYNRILVEILPHMKIRGQKPEREQKKNLAPTILLLIGSERGLCGKFNENLVHSAKQWILEKNLHSFQIWAMGTRLVNHLEKAGMAVSWRKPLPSSALISYEETYRFTQTWIEQYEAYQFNQFYVLHNQKIGSGSTTCSSFRLLPYEVQHQMSVIEEEAEAWPPPIIETDPNGIYNQIIQHYIASSLYRILLLSAVAEHSARYNLMEEANDNTEEIIDELRMVINRERKRKITKEMQELAAGAGLLEK
jgi:F-type H+-transporting ATPase subunit gamma